MEIIWKLEPLKYISKNLNYLIVETPKYSTRGKTEFSLKPEKCKLNLTYKNILNSPIIEYNKLLMHVKELIIDAVPFAKIARHLKAHIFNEQFLRNEQ